MDPPALEQAHRPAMISPTMTSPNPPQAAPRETPKVASGSSIMPELAKDNVGSIKSKGKAKAVREPSPESALARLAQQKVFVPDPKALSFTPLKTSPEVTKVETPSLLRSNLSLHSPGKVLEADQVKDTGMSGNETLSIPAENPAATLGSSRLRIPDFLKSDVSSNDAGAAARRQYGGVTSGQAQRTTAHQEAPSAEVTTEQPHLQVEEPSPSSAKPIPASTSSKWEVPAFIRNVASENDAGAAARRQYGGAAKGQVQSSMTSKEITPSADTTSGLSKLHISAEPEFSSAGGLGSSKWSEAPEQTAVEVIRPTSRTNVSTTITPIAETSIPASSLPMDQDSLDDVVTKMNDFSLGGAKKRSSSKGIKVPKKPREDIFFKTLKAHAAGDMSMSSPLSTPAKPSPEKENPSGCELGQSMWANASASPMPTKAPSRAPGNKSAIEGRKQKSAFAAPVKPPMPAWMKGTDDELRWLGASKAPIAMKWMPPPEEPAPASPIGSSENAPPVQRKTFFVPTAQPESSKPKFPAFLASNVGPSDPGAAARKQYGGFAPKTEAQPVEPSGSSSNGAAAPLPRSPSPQLPGLGASRWAAPAQASPAPRSSSPQLPGLGASRWATPAQASPVPRSSSPQLPGLGASRWAAPAPAPTSDDKPFVQPTLPGRKNNGGGKRNYRKGW